MPRRECCADTPIDQLVAVTMGSLTWLICGECTGQVVFAAAALGARCDARPFLSWVACTDEPSRP